MSAGMEKNDVQYGLEMAWHKLTTIVTAIREGFKFEYDKKPIAVDGKTVDGWFWLAGSDDGQLVGVPQYESYGVISNAQFWELIDNALAGTGAQVVSLGTFGGRSKRYASIKIGTEWERFKIGDREFQNLLNIQDAVDGSMPLIAKGSNTCIVCANTFGMSLREKGDFKLSLRHTKNVSTKLENFSRAIEEYRGMTALFRRLLEDSESVTVSEDKARSAYLGFLTKGEEASTRSKNVADRMTELFRAGKGCRGQTGLDLISGATDYFTHESAGESDNAWKQVTSSEIGSGSRMKVEFMNRIRTQEYGFSKKAFAELVREGEKALTVA